MGGRVAHGLSWAAVTLLASVGFAGARASGEGAALTDDTVQWTASLESPRAPKPGSRLTISLRAVVRDGWHVYGLRQQASGPTALRVALDSNAVATVDGASSGTQPLRLHDARFGVDVEFYTGGFSLRLPVRLVENAQPGRQWIPVSVRFQSCSEQVCLPPRTIHLSLPLDVVAQG